MPFFARCCSCRLYSRFTEQESRVPSTRPIAIAAVLAAVCALGWYWRTYAWLPEGASTVSLLHAADTFDQCSREVPFTRGPYWVPTASQIRAIEPMLPALTGQARPRYDPGTPFARQYIGFTRAGKRLVYLNVVVHHWQLDEHRWIEHVQRFVDRVLPERPNMLCDGGVLAWGVVYDPATGLFEQLTFNGQ